MAIEYILLLTISAFLLGNVFFGEGGPQATFKNSSPRLGARIERHLETGSGFRAVDSKMKWERPRNNHLGNLP